MFPVTPTLTRKQRKNFTVEGGAMPYNKQQILETVDFFRSKNIKKIDIAVVLGSGLSSIVDIFPDKEIIPYHQVPNMSSSGVAGHSSNFVYVEHHGKNVLLMQGRRHMYEGYDAFTTAFPIAVAGELNARTAILTNAAGSINPDIHVGDIMLISDHIKMQNDSPLIGVEGNQRFLDMQNAYDVSLLPHLSKAFGVKSGIYGSVLGPQYETPAEVQMFRKLGMDAVGMSTVMETILARYYRMRVLGFSMITNQAAGLGEEPINHEEVLQQGKSAGSRLASIVSHLLICDTANL